MVGVDVEGSRDERDCVGWRRAGVERREEKGLEGWMLVVGDDCGVNWESLCCWMGC